MNSAEPIAVIGMACRFAGGIDSLEKFWNLMCSRGDVVGEVPDGRWDWYATQGHEYAAAVRDVTRHGAFLDDVRGFDADFFDITPREAALMDPQQRIALELAWEALEHAGVPPHQLRGTDTAVYMGVGSDDYGRRLLEDLPGIEAWTGIGSQPCGVANRVSYVLDLRGPSVAVDTACSSSLVTTHLAVQALRAGECPLALAGGVLVMAAPGLSIVLDSAAATAPDGRSKAFDARADGYGRGEGAGVVVLKRLSDARRDGDRVLAVIRGGAVRQDGRTNGIMAPSGEAQAHLLRRAYQSAGVEPSTVGYVEAHGTGTRAGDPIEAGALTAVFAPGRTEDQPLLIGSVKTNIGHLEAAAGVAGLIKTVLALRHGAIPPSLHFTTPNPAIPWDTARLRVVTELTPWPERPGPRRAGICGYGYGGTIAHLILEQAEEEPARPAVPRPGPALYPLSAASRPALGEHAGRLAARLTQDPDLDPGDLGYTLARRRTHLKHRAAVLAGDRAELIERLADLAGSGDRSPTGTIVPAAGDGPVWVFSGHGSQWTGMARELLATDPVFAGVFAELEPVFLAELGVSPRAVVASDTDQPVDVTQPMIFAVQVGLAAIWRAAGLRPGAAVGHSVGEIAAAVSAGVFTVEQGAQLVCRRSVLLRQVAGEGAMAMVSLPAEEVARRLDGRGDIAVAVVAGISSTVISGGTRAVADLSQRWRAEGIPVRPVDSDVAFHSPQMDPLTGPLREAVADLAPGRPRLPLYTTALADPRSGAPRDAAYWATNLRRPVRFAQAVTAALEDGHRLFLEVSPHPVVEHSINETFADLGIQDGYVTHSLRRGRRERATLLTNLARLYCHGAEVDWSAQWPGGGLADLPGPAWQHRPFWAEERTRPGPLEPHDPATHTLLGGRRSVIGTTPARAWLTHLDRDNLPSPGNHPVRGVEILPAAVLVNTILAAAAQVGPWPDLSSVSLRVPVTVTAARELQVVLQDGTVRISSRPLEDTTDDIGWVAHTTAAVEPHTGLGETSGTPAEAGEELAPGHVVDRLAGLGVAAMAFPWVVRRLRRAGSALLATVDAGHGPTGTPTWAPVLDAAFSIASVAFDGPPLLRMPAHIDRLSLTGPPPARAGIAVRVGEADTVDVEVTDRATGAAVGRLSRLRYGELDPDAAAATNPRHLVHRLTWRPAPRTDPDPVPALLLVGPDSALLAGLISRLRDAAVPHRVSANPAMLSDGELAGVDAVVVVPDSGLPGQVAEAATGGSWLLARTAQRLATGDTTAGLWCVTTGVRECADERALGHGAVWGLGRIIGGEHPELWRGIIDIGPSEKDAAALVETMRTVRGEDVVTIRDGLAEVPRLHRLIEDAIRLPDSCRPEATYLITGGLGALGLQVARWLAGRGARRIVLASRRAMPPREVWDALTDRVMVEQVATVRALERLGVTVATVAVDVADPEAASKLLSPAALGLPPIRGVIHAAGVIDNRTVRALDEDSLRTVLRPKVAAALVLHSLFPPGSVDFFVLFSSCGYLLGLPGQASYAAGNAFLDALAAHRRHTGDHATTSLAWTSWRGLGMSTSSAVIDVELAARGTADISVAEGFGAWEVTERHDLGYAAVLRTIPLPPGQQRPPLLSELPPDAPVTSAPQPPAAPWAAPEYADPHQAVSEEIRRQVAAETKLAVAEVDPRRPLVEMGVDSVMMARIRIELSRRFGLPLPATLFWEQPTVDAIAAWLTAHLTNAAAPEVPVR